MTVDEAREELLGVKDCKLKLDALVKDLINLRQQIQSLQGVDYSRDVVTGGTSGDLSDVIEKLDEKTREVMEASDELTELRRKAEATIRRIKSYKVQAILFERYINGKKFEDLEKEMGYSLRQIYRLHRIGLKEYAKIKNMSLNVTPLT